MWVGGPGLGTQYMGLHVHGMWVWMLQHVGRAAGGCGGTPPSCLGCWLRVWGARTRVALGTPWGTAVEGEGL